MSKPDTIIRFYKPTAENMESLEKQYIYLFSAKQWKDAHEMQFEVNTNDPAALKQYVTEEIERAFLFPKESGDYKRYFGYRYDLLDRHGRINMFTSEHEKDHLVELSIKEITSEKIKASKKGLIRNNFFSKTGISCFTADKTMLEDRFHWLGFGGTGEGFCVEYDWPLLERFFDNTNVGIRGDYVQYYNKDKPKLILQSGYSKKVMDNYCDIIFSLNQSVQDEKEFRLAKVFKEDIPDQDDRRKEQIPPDAIKTIFLGPKVPEHQREKITNIVKVKLAHVQLMMIDHSGGSYKVIPLPDSTN